MHDDDKKAAALAAIDEVRAGMLVGLGSGSTAAFAIQALGERVARGLSITAVATSRASEALAHVAGIPVVDFADVAQIDLTIDGVDEIAPDLTAVKGAGGAMLREKVVAAASLRMVAIADGSKRVAHLGRAKLPVEVLPFAREFTARALCRLCSTATVRMDGARPFQTDNGNIVFDCFGWPASDPHALATILDSLPGVVGHGLFLTEVAAAYVAEYEIVTRVERDRLNG